MKPNKDNQIKEILNKLEQLVLKAEKDKTDSLCNYGEDSIEYAEAEAYESGAFTAFAIVKKVIEGDYE